MLVLTEIHSDAFHEQLVILLVLGMYQLGRRGKEAIVSIDCQKDTYKNLVRWCHVCGVLVCSDHEIYVHNCRTGVLVMILIVGWNCVVSGSVPVECGVTGIIPDHFSGTIPVSPRDPPVCIFPPAISAPQHSTDITNASFCIRHTSNHRLIPC